MTFSYPCLPGGTVPAGSAVCCVPKGWEKTELGEVGVLGRCSKGRAGNDVILLCIWLTGPAWMAGDARENPTARAQNVVILPQFSLGPSASPHLVRPIHASMMLY